MPPKTAKPDKYRVLHRHLLEDGEPDGHSGRCGSCGIDYDPMGRPSGDPNRQEKRVWCGDVVDDFPQISVPWLLAQGFIEEIGRSEDVPSPEPVPVGPEE